MKIKAFKSNLNAGWYVLNWQDGEELAGKLFMLGAFTDSDETYSKRLTYHILTGTEETMKALAGQSLVLTFCNREGWEVDADYKDELSVAVLEALRLEIEIYKLHDQHITDRNNWR